ncbi:MAG TPA: hypothetical protein VFU36_12305 [Jatrophihabitans sp.]|nr:hypothetical protein [Jatrophihabitans sp.]
MVFTTVPWLLGKRRRAGTREPVVPDAPVELVAPEPAGLVAPEPAELDVPAQPYVPPFRKNGAAAATRDRFMDAVVLISVLIFLILAAGVGLLVLRSTALWP